MKLTYYIKTFILLLVLCSFLGCRKDLGNYVYTEVNSLEIKGIENEYIIESGTNPHIEPVLSFSKDPDFSEDKYNFEWIAFNQAAQRDQQRTDLAKSRNFDMPFPLGIGLYSVYYKVTEKSTGVSWQTSCSIRVTGAYKGGWAVLSEVAGNSRLDYFEYDHATGMHPKSYRNFNELFADKATGKVLKLMGKPKFVAGWQNRTSSTGTSYKYFIYVGTETQTEKINCTDGFIWDEKYAFKFESAGAMALNYVHNIMPFGAGTGYSYYNGDVFFAYDVAQLTFGTPINRLTDNTYFKVSRYTAVSLNANSPVILMYDMDNKRFVRNQNSVLTSVSPLPYTAGVSAFNPNSVGMDMVWMGQTFAYTGRAYAVLKDNANKYFLARMNNAASFSAYAMDEISSLPEIDKANNFAVDQQYGYLHYSVAGKLYQYDVDTKTTKLMKDYGSRIISLLKYNQGANVKYDVATRATLAATYGKRFIPVVTGLICATYDPSNPDSSGEVDLFQVPQFNGPFTVFYSFNGFGKVVDMANIELPYGF